MALDGRSACYGLERSLYAIWEVEQANEFWPEALSFDEFMAYDAHKQVACYWVAIMYHRLTLLELAQKAPVVARNCRSAAREVFSSHAEAVSNAADMIDALLIQLQDKIQLEKFGSQVKQNMQDKVNESIDKVV